MIESSTIQEAHAGTSTPRTRLDAPAPGQTAAPAAKRRVTVETGDHLVAATNDPWSDRLRCDHPPTTVDGEELAASLVEAAEDLGRGRIVALVPAPVGEAMIEEGFELEGVMPGFYRGQEDCAVLGAAIKDDRLETAHPEDVARTDVLIAQNTAGRRHPRVPTERATAADAAAISALLTETFVDYPSPTTPAWVASQINRGTPFRIIRDGLDVVACASADLVREARTAELTDCATRPSHRGRGLMQSVLLDLMADVAAMDYPTAFTLARARIPGVNLAFQRLGFHHRGRMTRSCRIGEGLEDMNIWSRRLERVRD